MCEKDKGELTLQRYCEMQWDHACGVLAPNTFWVNSSWCYSEIRKQACNPHQSSRGSPTGSDNLLYPFFQQSLLLREDSALSTPASHCNVQAVTWGFCYVDFDSLSLGWGLRVFISKKLPGDANLLRLLHGSHFKQQNSIREVLCGNPCYFKLRGNEVKRAPFFQPFFYLSQVPLDVYGLFLEFIVVVSLYCLY